MTIEEAILDLIIKNAVLNEKVNRLEYFVYGTLTFSFLQLMASFFLWAKDLIDKRWNNKR